MVNLVAYLKNVTNTVYLKYRHSKNKDMEVGDLVAYLKNVADAVYLKCRILTVDGVWKITLQRVVGFNFSEALNAKLNRLFTIRRGQWLCSLSRGLRLHSCSVKVNLTELY